MKALIKNSQGATAVEFGLVALPVLLFILGIIQTAWIVWAGNLLYLSVDTAARCGAVNSTTAPCTGVMTTTASAVFSPLTGATFAANTTCSSDGGSGLVGTYTVSILSISNLTLTARSCYPNV
jgi:Flp pilus assembly protein TadG